MNRQEIIDQERADRDKAEDELNESMRQGLRWRNAAKRILTDNDIVELFDIIEQEHVVAFKNMPINSNFEEYKVVHLSLMSILQLRKRLQDFIDNYDILEKRSDIDFEMAKVNV